MPDLVAGQGWRAAESAELPEELRPFVAEINGRRELYGGVALPGAVPASGLDDLLAKVLDCLLA